jgi:hypothetical protein
MMNVLFLQLGKTKVNKTFNEVLGLHKHFSMSWQLRGEGGGGGGGLWGQEGAEGSLSQSLPHLLMGAQDSSGCFLKDSKWSQ